MILSRTGESRKVTTIPDAVRAKFPEIVERAIADGLCCKPADRPRAEAALRRIYKAANLNPNVQITWVESPPVGAAAASVAAGHRAPAATDAAVYSAVDSAAQSAVRSTVNSDVYSAVYSAVYLDVDLIVNLDVYSAVYSAVHSDVYFKRQMKWHPWRGGSAWVSWPAFCEAIMALGIDHPSFEAIKAEREIAASCGYYWPNRDFIIVCERPKAINRDAQGRLHNASGPAVDYGKTFRLYCWHGITIPGEWIENKAALTPEIALRWPNIEQRRAACALLGWASILKSIESNTINTHHNPEVGQLVEVTLGGSPARFLRVLCGTGREFALPMPMSVNTALEAQAWSWGLDVADFVPPSVRT